MADTPVAFDAATVVGSLQDPVFAITTDGDVAFANRRFLEITRFDREALVGADYRIVADVIEEGFENVEHAFALVATGRSDEERAQMRMHHPDDAPVPQRMPAEGRFTPIREGGDIVGVTVSFRNITERVERERELARQNERLDRFASVVSHDLRNPLNVASGHLELARETGEDGHLDAVANAHERMQSLVDGLLTLARGGERDPDCEPVSIDAAARRAWASVETADATLVCRAEGRVLADPSRLGQLFENLFR
ncbi:MAG: histidine kinase dimerization/phospho-acceptor domain-containing protein, partial [Halarchaeum sp.]